MNGRMSLPSCWILPCCAEAAGSGRHCRRWLKPKRTHLRSWKTGRRALSAIASLLIGTNSADEQQKVTQHLTLVTAAVILHNVIELTRVFRELAAEGVVIRRRDVEHLSPYLTRHIKRFGEYYLDISRKPDPLDGLHDLPDGLFQPEPGETNETPAPDAKGDENGVGRLGKQSRGER